MAIWALLAGLLGIVAPLAASHGNRAEAVTGADFDPGDIIADGIFFNSSAMNEAQVQAFLNAQVPNCAAGNGWPCLKDLRTATSSRSSSGTGHCAAYQGEPTETAARVIVKVAQACGINPQVLIVMLQKEQGLVTATSPTERQYRVAMGYACPDTAPCDTQYYGFANQVYMAAWQLRQYTNFPDRRYKVGAVSIQFHPNTACGSTVVNIVNQATANLYNYTPYQPNAAALANLGGTGDACSSYGNRNFWVHFNNWFGPTTTADNPFGNVEQVSTSHGKLRISGWAIDPNTASPIDLHVYINGVGHRVTADLARSDVAAAFPGFGQAHGFDRTFDLLGGAYEVCIYGYNVGAGGHTLFGCPKAAVPSGAPFGTVEAVTVGESSITVSGWAIDPDTAESIAVHVYVDSAGAAFQAALDRSDVARAYPVYGPKHGYSQQLAVQPGAHDVCVYAINTGAGGHTLLGCNRVDVPGPPGTIPELGRAPLGNFEAATPSGGQLTVSGWAIDPDTSASIPVHIYIDGVGTAYAADRERDDVGSAYPGYGSRHGFSEQIAVAPGPHDVCVFAINTGPGPHTLLDCRTVVVPALDGGRVPFGNFEAAVATTTGIEVIGWALDLDTTGPIPVHVYVDGVGAAYTADEPRADVGRAYPGYGEGHGFRETIATAPGNHRVCVYAINLGGEPHALLGCRTLTS
ncbi:hypothetical protein ACFWN7_16300 [Agromyces sp. NPDC058484]|uniref:hypothetical protein n=1 Tax=Agromyces sp. NPDC058484 TaxID=3346524 RepID=UPI003646B303